MVALSSSAQGQVPCGCPYKTKTEPTFDSSRLMVINNSSNTCAISCERGYMLELRANYVECSNGISWNAQHRESFKRLPLIDNPALTCRAATPKTCPPDTWKTFTCPNCDSSKIMVTPGAKGECTIMCDRGFRLLMNNGSGSIATIAEATLQSANWITFAFGSMNTSESTAASAATFNCELLPGTKPKPPACGCGYDFLEGDDYDQTQLTASGTEGGTCRVECQKGYTVVSDSVTGSIPFATCAQYQWSAPDKGDLSAPLPKFSCAKAVTPPASACKKCTDNMITMKSIGTAVLTATTDSIGTCAVRTFVCTGKNELATLEVNDSDLGTVSDEGTVTLSVNCNAAGTDWTSCGKPVTQLECSSADKPACKRCADDLITITTTGSGAHPMTSETRDESGECTTRTFVCEGPHANIEINGGKGSISDDKRATFTVTCSVGESNWVAYGIIVEKLECSYGRL